MVGEEPVPIEDKVILHDHCDCTEQNREIRNALLDTMQLVKEIHNMVASADMRARLAFGEAQEAKRLVDKNQADIKFLIPTFKKKENGNGTQRGISV